jgi:hypothetical protein
MSALDDLPPLRDAIRRHGLSAKKSLGQNFLLDLNLTGRIARAAGPLEGVTAVEVGPGPGVNLFFSINRSNLLPKAHLATTAENNWLHPPAFAWESSNFPPADFPGARAHLVP